MSHTLTEGGQITMHRIRMFRQVMKTSFIISIFLGVVIFTVSLISVSKDEYLTAWYCCKAWFIEGIKSEIQVDKEFMKQKYHFISKSDPYLSVKEVYRLMLPEASQAWNKLYIRSIWAITSSFASFLCILLFFFYRGKVTKAKTHISGPQIDSAKRIARKLRKMKKASSIQIGDLPLVKGSETQHLLITGGTGAGKTNCLHHLIGQIRRQKQKTIIVDTSGVFVEKYFDTQKDILLNPFDSRSKPWNPWAELDSSFDYADLAASFIPSSHLENEQYWRIAARSVFVSLLQKFSDLQKTSEINHWIQYETLVKLCEALKGTKAAAHIDLASEKTASSVRSVCSTFLESLECLADTTDPFSIKKWIAQTDDSWLFIQCKPAQREKIRPLLAAWISTAIRGLLNLPYDIERRIWFIIDELPTLEKIKDLDKLLTEGRKYGGCAVLALQSPSQLETIYGRQTTHTIIGNAATRIVFRERDPEIAERISRIFGDCELREVQEGISYGAHEARDGVNLSNHIKRAPVISPSQVMDLPINTAYVKLAGELALAKIKIAVG